MTRPRTFYVYVHAKPDGDVFYVGKGSWSPKKAYGRSKSTENRNIIWRRTVEKYGGFTSTVVAEFFDEAAAFEYEAALIAESGRRDRGGRLCNLTDGGEGAVGRLVSAGAIERRKATMATRPKVVRPGPMTGKRHTEERKAAIGRAVSGSKNGMHGKSHSAEARAKMVAAKLANRPRARKVVDTPTGIVYPSVREAARQLGLNQNTLKAQMAGRYTNRTSLEFA